MTTRFRLLVVGKLKAPYAIAGCAFFLKRLTPWCQVEIEEVRDAESELPIVQRKRKEGERLLAKLEKNDWPLVLDEHGTTFTSSNFARLLQSIEQQAQTACFILGGPFGLSEEVLGCAKKQLSLSPMTMPHDLARLVLLEQLYRAQCIVHHTPYHH